jgi:membrane protease YdiL (CAAX protease family)
MQFSTDENSIRVRLGRFLNKSIFLCWFSLLIVLGIAGIVLWAGNKQNSPPLALSSIAIAWILFRGLMWLQKYRWSDFGFQKPKSWAQTIIYALGGTVLLHILISLVLAPPIMNLTKKPVNSSQFEILRGNPIALIIGLVIVWALAAFGEEMIFRGYVMHNFARPFNRKILGWVFAVVITSILFGLGHSYQGITGIILTAIVGIFYAVAFFASRQNLWLPILIHGFYDTSAFLIIYLGMKRTIS